MYVQTISCTLVCFYLSCMRNAIVSNKALNKTNFLNLRKLIMNIGKMRRNADRWRKTYHVSPYDTYSMHTCYTTSRKSQAQSSVGCTSVWQWKNAFPAGFTIQAKANTRFYAAENTLLHHFHQATCPIFMLNTQYVNDRDQMRFKLRMQMILHKYNVHLYNYM